MIEEAVVLAAGFGTRFSRSIHKLLVKLLGYHLVEFPIRSLAAAGVKRFVVVSSEHAREELSAAVERVVEDEGVEAEVVVNRETYMGNARSLLLGLARVTGEFSLVTMADHVYPSTAVVRLARSHGGSLASIGGDRSPRYVSVGEATLIKVDERGLVRRIGKNLEAWDYVDMGLHVVSAEVLGYASACAGFAELSAMYECLAGLTDDLVAVDLTGEPWKDVDTWEDYVSLLEGAAREVLLSTVESWRRTRKTLAICSSPANALVERGDPRGGQPKLGTG